MKSNIVTTLAMTSILAGPKVGKSIKASVIAKHGIWLKNPLKVRHCEARFVGRSNPGCAKQIASRYPG